MRFTFVAAAYHPSTPHSSGFARRVPRNAGELFTKPSFWRLFTRSSIMDPLVKSRKPKEVPLMIHFLPKGATFLLAVAVFLLPGTGHSAPLSSTSQDQENMAITIYNSNVGLVKDLRLIQLPPGVQELKFMDVAGKIDPTTVYIKSLVDEKSLIVLEQNYEYDLLSPQKLLEKFVGQKVQLVTVNPETKKEEIVDAVLLSVQGGNIFQIGDKISIGHPGRILLSRIPDNLIPQPTLVWLLDNKGQRPQKVEASYLTSGINWKADYVAVLNAADTLTDLTGWVTIDNKSGATYPDALLKLVAGDINRAREETVPERAMARMAMKETAPQFKEEAFFEYHLYTLDRRTTIKDNQTKQMSLLQASQVPVKKLFVFSGSSRFYYGRLDPKGQKQKVGVFLELENSQKNRLGMPLPKGIVRVYKEDKDGALQFVGEDRLDHTPKDERFKIKLGGAFDVVGERIQTDYKRLSSNLFEVALEVTLRNHKNEDIKVWVEEPIPGDWEMQANSHPYEKLQANLIRFEVPVGKDQEVKVKYRIRTRY
ncbi:MAG: DUF4139 domain-containing protein [Deltaproteobacteria bacterium]|nr:DUF4139 domain-containing protein [Deltaproteobacteria bacterium]